MGCIVKRRHATYLQFFYHKQMTRNIDLVEVFTYQGTSLRSTFCMTTKPLHMKNTSISQNHGLPKSPSNTFGCSWVPHTEPPHIQTKTLFGQQGQDMYNLQLALSYITTSSSCRRGPSLQTAHQNYTKWRKYQQHLLEGYKFITTISSLFKQSLLDHEQCHNIKPFEPKIYIIKHT